MKVYFFPGLGYDQQIFARLKLPLADTEYINWVAPEPGETIHAYAKRLFQHVENPAEDIVLVGHSLGGIIAQEIASVRSIAKVILISSIKSREELPWFFRIIRPLHLDKLFTKEMSIKTIRFWGEQHGFNSPEEKALFKNMVGQQTNRYLQWALRELSSWREPQLPASTRLVRIHGTHDQTFPFQLIQKPDFMLAAGSHLLVYKQADKVSEIIAGELMSSTK